MSNLAVILLMFIALELSIFAAFIIVAKAISGLNKRIDRISKLYSDAFEKLVTAYDGLRDVDKSRQEYYEKVSETYELMLKAYNDQHDIDEKIIKTWKIIEETYSNVYEEYRNCIEKIEAIDKANTDIYAKILLIEENTKPIVIPGPFGYENAEWDPFDGEEEKENEQI